MPGSEPDSGKPTVRDRRGACGNVDYGSRTEACWETSRLATEPYGCARRISIPTPLIHTFLKFNLAQDIDYFQQPTREKVRWAE